LIEISPLLPTPTRESQPYWDSLREGVLRLQRCADCGQVRHYPRPVCPACHSMADDWVDAQGTGTVHSWTISHHAFHPSFKRDLPQTFVTVDLTEGVRLLAPLRGNPDDLALGRAVRLEIEPLHDDWSIPVVRLA
jgi:uncharacterized OB-fold protein